MTKIRFSLLFVLLTAATALLLAGCGSDGGDPRFTPADGSVDVYAGTVGGNGTDAPPEADSGLAAVNVTFTELMLYKRDGTEFSLNGETVDLIQAQTTPEYLGSFDLAPGLYDCISASIDVVSITTVDDVTCDVVTPPNISVPKTCTGQPFLEVDENTGNLLIEIPVVSGSCPPDGSAGTLSLGIPSMQQVPAGG